MSIAGAASRTSSPPKSPSYPAALVLVGGLIPVPIVATIITAAIYIAPFPASLQALMLPWITLSWLAIIAGFGITLIFWLILALFFRGFTSLEAANPVGSSHLKNHFYAVRAGFAALNAPDDNGKSLPKERSYSYRIAYEQVKSYLEEIASVLDRNDVRWIAGTGYLHAWSLVHRAEEAMITLEPREEAIREAIYDEMCLIGSSIDAGASALKKLRRAVKNLSLSATQYLDRTDDQDTQKSDSNSRDQQSDTTGAMPLVIVKNSESPTADAMPGTRAEGSVAPTGTVMVTARDPGVATTNGTPKVAAEEPRDAPASGTPRVTAQDPGGATTSEKPEAGDMEEMEARNALRDARRTINEYRDHLWEGLVTERNRLMGTALFTGLLTYVLLCFAIIAGTSSVSIIAAIAFYLVGALVGLFSRLYRESKVEGAADDYQLTLARITITPVLCGLAGVGGVLLTTLLSLTLVKSAIPQTPGTASQQLGLVDGYNLQRNTFGILIAAVFGLTPNLFIDTLQQKAKDYTDQLQNTGAADQTKSGDQKVS